MKRKETFADRVAAFIVGALVGLFVAWGLMTFHEVESGKLLIGVVIGCGFFAVFGWNWFWEAVGWFFKTEGR